MPSWIETEDKTILFNADQIVSIDTEGVEPNFRLIAYLPDGGSHSLISGLTKDQARAAYHAHFH